MEIGREWVAALRSGEFKQGRYALNAHDTDGNTYCCLGVLCEIAVKHGIVSKCYESVGFVGYGVEMDIAYPPVAVQKWAGLDDSRGGAISYMGRLRALSHLNDVLCLSFDEIATEIEKQLLGGGS